MKKLVVCGATGTQGGSVIEVMKDSKGWELYGFSRDSNSEGAQNLQSAGVHLSWAHLESYHSLIKVFRDADGVFGMTQPWNIKYTKCDTNAEWRQGKNIVDACKEVGVGHLVLSTVAHLTDEKTGLPHVDIKIDIEQYAKQSGVPTTYLKPAQFMDNVGMKFLPVKKGKIRGFVAGDAKVPYVATQDIGKFAQIAFENPDEYIGKEVKLIGDFVSGDELADIMGNIRGEMFKYGAVPKWIIWIVSREFYAMRIAFEELAYSDIVDQIPPEIEKCKKINPDLLSMADYLKSNGWESRIL
jgi:uncharacterized protein YbjT (DUF2867 family)